MDLASVWEKKRGGGSKLRSYKNCRQQVLLISTIVGHQVYFALSFGTQCAGMVTILEREDQRAVGLLNVKVTATNRLHQTRQESSHLQLGWDKSLSLLLTQRWSTVQQNQDLLRACLKCSISGPTLQAYRIRIYILTNMCVFYAHYRFEGYLSTSTSSLCIIRNLNLERWNNSSSI